MKRINPHRDTGIAFITTSQQVFLYFWPSLKNTLPLVEMEHEETRLVHT